jgi:glycerate-2-kinase
VTNPGGRGGRNLEYLLGLAIELGGAPGIYALACDTTASTAPRTMPARSSRPIRWSGPKR